MKQFEYTFDALYDLNDYIRKNMGINNIKLIPFNPYDNNKSLLVLIKFNCLKDIESEMNDLNICCKYFFDKYDINITKNIFIDIDV